MIIHFYESSKFCLAISLRRNYFCLITFSPIGCNLVCNSKICMKMWLLLIIMFFLLLLCYVVNRIQCTSLSRRYSVYFIYFVNKKSKEEIQIVWHEFLIFCIAKCSLTSGWLIHFQLPIYLLRWISIFIDSCHHCC